MFLLFSLVRTCQIYDLSSEDSAVSEDKDDDVEMAEDDDEGDAAAAAIAKEAAARLKSGVSDPNDLSAYNLDDYDKEESKGSAMGAFSNIKYVITLRAVFPC